MQLGIYCIVQEDEDDQEDDEEAGADEEVVLPEGMDLDPVVMSTLPPSMQVLYSDALDISFRTASAACHGNHAIAVCECSIREHLQ